MYQYYVNFNNFCERENNHKGLTLPKHKFMRQHKQDPHDSRPEKMITRV